MHWLAVTRIPPTEERTTIFDSFSKNPTTCVSSGASVIVVDCFVVKSVAGDCDVTIDKCTNFVDKKVKVVEFISARVVVGVAIDTDPNFVDVEVVVVEIISLRAVVGVTKDVGTNFVDGKIMFVQFVSVRTGLAVIKGTGTNFVDGKVMVVKSDSSKAVFGVTKDIGTNFVDDKVMVVEVISAGVVVGVTKDIGTNFFDGKAMVVEIISLRAVVAVTKDVGTNFIDGKIMVVEIISVGAIGGFTDSVIDFVRIPKLNKKLRYRYSCVLFVSFDLLLALRVKTHTFYKRNIILKERIRSLNIFLNHCSCRGQWLTCTKTSLSSLIVHCSSLRGSFSLVLP